MADPGGVPGVGLPTPLFFDFLTKLCERFMMFPGLEPPFFKMAGSVPVSYITGAMVCDVCKEDVYNTKLVIYKQFISLFSL